MQTLRSFALVILMLATAAPALAQAPLASGVWKQVIGGRAGTMHYFSIDVPAGSPRLKIDLVGPWYQGNSDLYVRRGSNPTLGTYFARSASSSDSESITINAPAPGRWHIGVYCKTTISVHSVRAIVTPPPPPPPEVFIFNLPFVSTLNYWQTFIDLPPGKQLLKFELIPLQPGYVGDPSLQWRYGSEPTGVQTPGIEYHVQYAGESNEAINLEQPAAGRHYIRVTAASSFSNVRLRITVQ